MLIAENLCKVFSVTGISDASMLAVFSSVLGYAVALALRIDHGS